MKPTLPAALIIITLLACQSRTATPQEANAGGITGTWRLLSGTLIEKGDTTTTDYSKGISFIKIINKSHFAFMQHDLNKGKDSAAVFAAGGGTYTYHDGRYTEHLEYCSAREWEGHQFDFTISIKGDTLVQRAVEAVKEAGINRENIETYVRLSN